LAERVIRLSVPRVGRAAEASVFHVDLDGRPVNNNLPMSAAQWGTVQELGRRYGALFETHLSPPQARERAQALGAALFDLWLSGVWEKLTEQLAPSDRRVLVVASEFADVLNLPWELLRLGGGESIGADAKYSLRRLPWTEPRLPRSDGRPPAGPLRILFMACAPQCLPALDYEREEEFLLRAIAKPGPRVMLDTGDLGTFEELRERINEFRPHIVHLTGHGRVEEDGGYFAFEDEQGRPELRRSQEIGQLFAGSGVQCAFVSGCETGRAPAVTTLGGVCQGLVGEGVPLAIGWAASILDDVANALAATFYGTVAAGQTVDRALVQARQAVRPACERRGDLSWSLPVLYSATAMTQGLIWDPEKPPLSISRPRLALLPLPGMTRGSTEHFIGRRRELQRLLPGLREGRLQGVVLTGLGGAGKSTLATRLARKLEADGFVPIALTSSLETPLTARLLESCGDTFLATGQARAHDILSNAQLGVSERLRMIATVLNQNRFVLVLDNFEENLDEASRRVRDPELAGFYRHLLEHLSGGSRLIITSRYLPADGDPLPETLREEQLGDFPEAAFLKFLFRDAVVEERYYRGELPLDLLARLHRLLGGTPRFLAQMREVLKTIPAHELALELDRVALPAGAESGKLQAARDGYCETIFTARLYGWLDTEEQVLLSRAAVYGTAVTVECLAAAGGTTVERMALLVREAQRLALVYREAGIAEPDAVYGALRSQRSGQRGELWVVYGVLRGWLLERLDRRTRRTAHQAAGDFLQELERQDRESELGLSWGECLLEARTQYLTAEAWGSAREVTGRLSAGLVQRGLYGEAEQINRELLEQDKHAAPMLWIARSLFDRADNGGARQWYERALAWVDLADKERAQALHGLATIDLNEGAYAAAREKFERSLAISEQISDRANEAATLHQLARIDRNQGADAAAREKYERSAAISQQISDRAGGAATWNGLAIMDFNKGAYSAAREKFERSLALYKLVGDPAGEAETWHWLARIDLDKHAYAAAREKAERSLAINQRIGGRTGEAAGWHQLASIDLYEHAYAAAREKFERSLAMRQEIDDRAGEAETWHQLAAIDLNEGVSAAAREKFERSLAISKRIGDRAGEAATWHGLASVDLNDGAYAAAREKFERSLAMRQEIGDRAGEAATWYQLGALVAEQGHPTAALRLLALCFLIDQSIGHGNAAHDRQAVRQMAAQLRYRPQRIETILREVADTYQRDRGRELLRSAFDEPVE
jgi:tetratricopeptide (TPR) repeat protein